MKRIYKGAITVVDIGVACTFGYWALMVAAYWVDAVPWPDIPHIWIFLGLTAGAVRAAERAFPSLKEDWRPS